MPWFESLRNSVVGLFRGKQAERDLDDEMRDHMASEIEANIQAGMSPEEARFAAQRLVGSVALYKEECRDQRGIGFVETTMRDLRYAFRMLSRTPLFTAVAMITLAIGIGANTTVFTFIDNILLRSVVAQDPERLVALNWGGIPNLSYPNYLDLRDRNQVFSDVAGYRYGPANMEVPGRDNFRGWGYEASGNYFRTLGVQPKLGRLFGVEDDQPGAPSVVVLSYRAWQGHFGGDPDVAGKTLKINGFPFTVIGVAAESFSGTELVVAGEYWVPMSTASLIDLGDNDWMRRRQTTDAWAIGRLKPGVTAAQAEGNLNQIASALAHEYPNELTGKTHIHLSKPGLVGDGLRQPVTSFGMVLIAVTGLGLLLACVNLAGMLLARASDRRREVGIRLAVGASRFQLLRQLMTESLLLALCGGVLGYGLATLICRLLSEWRPGLELPVNLELTPNLTVLGFTFAATLMTTLLCGLIPALQTVRVDLVPSLKNEPLSTRFQRWSIRDLTVVAQIALSVVLIICSVLVVRSLQHALTLRLGFNPERAVAVSFDLGLKGYDGDHIRRLQADLLRDVAAMPGIEAAGIANALPLSVEGQDSEFIWHANEAMPAPADRKLAMVYNISPGYLSAAGTRLLAGRNFDDGDRHDGKAVAIVNQVSARTLFGDRNPVGQQFRVSSVGPGLQIVGVVEDGKYTSLGEEPRAAVFVPAYQQENRWTTLVVRTGLPPAQVAEQLRRTVLKLDPGITIFNAGSLRDHLAIPLLGARIAAIVLGIFGVFAMTLAAIGLFALVSYAVSRRTREIGIRMALGARRGQVLSSLLSRTLVLCGFGIVVGVSATLAVGQFLSAVLYEVSPRDPLAYALVLVLMVAVALVACSLPAARAMRVDPMRALREE